jgi:hypothetical protein
LNDFGLGNIDQLAVHKMQESAWDVGGGILRKTCRALGMASVVKGKDMEVIGDEGWLP